MSDPTQSIPALFDPSELAFAAAAFCGRCGEPGAEAARLMLLKEVLRSSRTLVQTLESFTQAATKHYQGVHCTANMGDDVAAVSRALMHWSASLHAAGSAHRDWREAAVGDSVGGGHAELPVLADVSRYPIFRAAAVT